MDKSNEERKSTGKLRSAYPLICVLTLVMLVCGLFVGCGRTDSQPDAEGSRDVVESNSDNQTEALLADNRSDIQFQGVDGDLSWSIDVNGKLVIEGVGDYSQASSHTSDKSYLDVYDYDGFDPGEIYSWNSDTEHDDWEENWDVPPHDGVYENRYPVWRCYSNYIVTAEVHVKGIHDLNSFFADCNYLESLDLQGLEAGEVTDMHNMFADCCRLRTVKFGDIDTSKVIDMSRMFWGCSSLSSLELNNWDVSSVQDMTAMFMYCEELSSLPIENWNTGQVQSIEDMFSNCESLEKLDITNWDTHSLVTMDSAFAVCIGLTSLDLSGWDTSNVRSMVATFEYCVSLQNLSLEGWDTSNVRNMEYMFYYCHLKELDLSGFDTGNVRNMKEMFSACIELKALNLSGWNTSRVVNMEAMFENCEVLDTLDVSGFQTGNVWNMDRMFLNCYSIPVLDVSSWDTSSVQQSMSMFDECRQLQSLDVSGFDMSINDNMQWMFHDCRQLTELDLTNWKCTKNFNAFRMFSNCRKLKTIGSIPWFMNATDITGLFENCRLLSCELPLGYGEFKYKKCLKNAAIDGNALIQVTNCARTGEEFARAVVDTKSEKSHVTYAGYDESCLSVDCTGDKDGFHISWDMAENVDSYEVYRCTYVPWGYDGLSEMIATIPGSGPCMYEDASGDLKIPRYYSVIARKGDQPVFYLNSEYKSAISSPTISSINQESEDSVLIWGMSTTNCNGYELEWSTSENFPTDETEKLVFKRKKNTKWTITGLEKDKTYYVRVRSYMTEYDGRTISYSVWSQPRSFSLR